MRVLLCVGAAQKSSASVGENFFTPTMDDINIGAGVNSKVSQKAKQCTFISLSQLAQGSATPCNRTWIDITNDKFVLEKNVFWVHNAQS